MDPREGVFLVTGGSSGLGAATVRRLHAAGGRIVICNRDGDRGERLAADLRNRAQFVRTDVTSENDVRHAIEVARREFGGLHGVVNCAGLGMAERVLGERGPHSLGSFAGCIEVNLIGTFNVIRLAAGAMCENASNAAGERGVIVNTASIVAYEGQAGHAAYAAAYAGVIGMTLPIARELGSRGIRVVTIAPGVFLTPRLEPAPADALDRIGRATPFPGRLGRPDEFAALVQHVIQNEMLNGETIRLDGGLRLGHGAGE
jgi:NAD(P)-dependent dehydrogenase (short-subunit alcohol dehydrogenase family)